MSEIYKADLLVLGGGPGGYTAAFRAADLGQSVTIVEKNNNIGGVCLNVGCIPSKALLHAASVIEEAENISESGIVFSKPEIDIDKLREHKESIIAKLRAGIQKLCELRNINIVYGTARIKDSSSVYLENNSDYSEITFKNMIIAAGSKPVKLSSIFPENDSRIWNSAEALALREIPEKFLIVGGGIIGLEMASVYSALGSSITVVEAQDQIIPAADPDIVKFLHRKLKRKVEKIMLETTVTGVENSGDKLTVIMKDKKGREKRSDFDRILVAVGRIPNSDLLDLSKAGIETDEKGFIKVNEKTETNIPGIYAIGDIAGNPMLAHKASNQGKAAAEVISGMNSSFNPEVIPSVAYTSPETAWAGITEKEAEKKGIKVETGIFPWTASGRALTSGASSGVTKLIFDADSKKLLGAGIAGLNAGELISETVIAINTGSDYEKIAESIHPHPSLSETIAFAAESAAGTVTEILPDKK